MRTLTGNIKPRMSNRARLTIFLIFLVGSLVAKAIYFSFHHSTYYLPDWVFTKNAAIIICLIALIMCIGLYKMKPASSFRFIIGSAYALWFLALPLIFLFVCYSVLLISAAMFATTPVSSMPVKLIKCIENGLSPSNVQDPHFGSIHRFNGAEVIVQKKDGHQDVIYLLSGYQYCSMIDTADKPDIIFYGRKSIFGTYIDGVRIAKP